ncbi:MAG: matrixin family metalloprotease [Candidatus Binatia bacterium]
MQLSLRAGYDQKKRGTGLLTRKVLASCPFLLVATILGGPPNVRASVVIPLTEAALAQQADAIIVGHVSALESRTEPTGEAICTYISVTVLEVWKGEIDRRTFTIKQLGGRTEDGIVHIEGAPEFTIGENVLLFLTRNADGTARVAQLYQGKFSLFPDQETGKLYAYRDPHPPGVQVVRDERSQEDEVTSGRTNTEADILAAHGFFEVAQLRHQVQHYTETGSRARTVRGAVPVLRSAVAVADPVSSGGGIGVQFNFATNPGARWFEPDSGIPIVMQVNLQGAPAGALTVISQALQAWSTVAGSGLFFLNGGATSAFGYQRDGENSISFNDPLRQIDPPVNCAGVLAVGGYFASGEVRTINGITFQRIVEGDVVLADGWQGCNVFESPSKLAEVLTHELGHVVGLGHSPNPDATMYGSVHFDGRGAQLHADDIAGLTFLYPGSSPSQPANPACTTTLSVQQLSFGAAPASGTIGVTASASTCGWTAASNVNWITMTSAVNAVGSSSVTFTVSANPKNVPRTGVVTVAGKTVTITQAARARRKPQSRL